MENQRKEEAQLGEERGKQEGICKVFNCKERIVLLPGDSAHTYALFPDRPQHFIPPQACSSALLYTEVLRSLIAYPHPTFLFTLAD